MSSKKYKFVRKVRKIKKYGWLKLKITVATSVVLSGVSLPFPLSEEADIKRATVITRSGS